MNDNAPLLWEKVYMELIKALSLKTEFYGYSSTVSTVVPPSFFLCSPELYHSYSHLKDPARIVGGVIMA